MKDAIRFLIVLILITTLAIWLSEFIARYIVPH